LKALEDLLKAQRRIDRDASDDLAARLDFAERMMADAYRLWTHLEGNADARQDELAQALGGAQPEWRALAEAWEGLGLIHRMPNGNSYCLRLATDLSRPAAAKCPAYGEVVIIPKRDALAPADCPACHQTAPFVLVATPSTHH
jgi:hypothetical protein